MQDNILLNHPENHKTSSHLASFEKEKIAYASIPAPKKPEWLKVKAPNSKEYFDTLEIVKTHKLNTVCHSAACPNIGECWAQKHATFMILGSTCTRSCRFCNIKTGKPDKINPLEPIQVAIATKKLGLKHVVITSVDRDDLPDGGAEHFAKTIEEIRKMTPNTSIEVLTPDFLRKGNAAKAIIDASPDIYNHNIETVPSLYSKIRVGANYYNSLRLLESVKILNSKIFTKSGIMLGLGETRREVLQVMEDLKAAKVDFLTIGQYLQPTQQHAKLQKYYSPEEFLEFKNIAEKKGFLMVASSPLTRSSYHAHELFTQLKNQYNANQ